MALEEYARKRDATKTPEPAVRGRRRRSTKPVFVIQHHLARADQYDFRLEIDGVLVSWAVPKGPSLDPRDKRMAKRTEDHPMAYRDFEGVIAKGQYGGGTVLVWDSGIYAPNGEMTAGLEKGHLSFTLYGKKLEGGWSLNRMADGVWLLVKKTDDHADRRRRPTSSQPNSVRSGRSMQEIADDG